MQASEGCGAFLVGSGLWAFSAFVNLDLKSRLNNRRTPEKQSQKS